MKTVAFNLFGINIYWYAVIITVAFIIGIIIAKIQDGRFNIKFDDFLDMFIITVPISILGARFYYIMFELGYYLQNPQEIFNIRNGGLAIYGGIIAGVLSIYVMTKIKKIRFIDVLDYVAPILALGQSIGRWGNFINGEAYGTETNLPWAITVVENGMYKKVHPTFLYESICTFIIFLILTKISKKRKFSGEITYIYIILYSFARFFIEGLRIDSLMLYNIRISQVLSLILFIVFCGILSHSVQKADKGKESSKK